jgi:hypothetical protein
VGIALSERDGDGAADAAAGASDDSAFSGDVEDVGVGSR